MNIVLVSSKDFDEICININFGVNSESWERC